MKFRIKNWALAGLLAAGLGAPAAVRAQGVVDRLPTEEGFARNSGQNVQPFFEGWQTLPDGKIVMWFGYLNRNYEEQPDVPIGPNNRFDLHDDMGQPTHFYPRRHLFVFKVDLPDGWDKERRLTWTVTSNGRTSSAHGWLQPEWEIDNGVIQMNIGPGGAPPADPPNTAPKISGSGDQSAAVGTPLKLTVSATDDGIPKPRVRANPAAAAAAAAALANRLPLPPGATPPSRFQMGLHIRWILYRAPVGGGGVSFEPESSRPVMGGQNAELTTQASFSAPGTYWLRAVASDGMLETPYDVKVTVAAKR